MHLRPCRPKPNTRPTQGGTGADAHVTGNPMTTVLTSNDNAETSSYKRKTLLTLKV